MALIVQLRGTNGSGKSTIVRHFRTIAGGGPIDLSPYDSPTRLKPDRVKRVEGYASTEWDAIIIGPYRTACGGMDALPGFKVCQEAIEYAVQLRQQPNHVLCEGVLASTVFGSWGAFADAMKAKGHTFVPAYLETPLDVCLSRIAQRQIATSGSVREIKTDQVASKVKAIAATRTRFLEAGHPVIDLPYGFEIQVMELVLRGSDEYFSR